MMKTFLATAAAALLVTSAPALAGNVVPVTPDPVVSAPAPIVVNDWTGPYVGAIGGWATGERVGVDDFDGLVYGAFAGYNYQLDNGFVLGGEVAGSVGEVEWAGGGTRDATYIDVKAKAGYAVDRALIYVSGGYTFASYDGGDEGGGFNVGGGVDFLLTDNIFVGAEYIYRDVEDTVNDPATWQEQFGTIQARIGITF